jgi:hypothetical protein
MESRTVAKSGDGRGEERKEHKLAMEVEVEAIVGQGRAEHG